MKYCPQCGTGFEPGARFCNECGFDKQSIETEITGAASADQSDKPRPQHQQLCPECTAPLPAEDRFCAECGFDKQAAAAAGITATDIPEETPREPEKPAKTCPECAALLTDEERFCPQCGSDTAMAAAGGETPADAGSAEVIADAVSNEQPAEEPVAESVAPDPVCPQCGGPLAYEERFCPGCGFDTSATPKEPAMAEPPAAPPAPPEPPAPPAQQADGQYCPNCGAFVVSGDLFCQDCGYRMTDMVAVATGEEVKQETKLPPPVVPVVEKPMHTPPVAAQASPPAALPAQPVVSEAGKPQKSRKGILVVLLALLGIAVLGAGGWYAYQHFLTGPKTEVAETPVVAEEIQQPAMTEPEPLPVDEGMVAEEPVEEKPVQKEPEKKAPQPKKTTPKKPAEAPKQQPAQEEPVKKNEPLTVVMKNTTTSKSPGTLYNTFNTEPVKGNPPFANKVKFDKAMVVTRIITFHYNEGNGAPAGTITLEGRKKETGGPWQARNAPGSDGTPNEKWICEPNARMEAGTYKVVVSDEKSWSFNTKSGRKGMVIIEGYEAD